MVQVCCRIGGDSKDRDRSALGIVVAAHATWISAEQLRVRVRSSPLDSIPKFSLLWFPGHRLAFPNLAVALTFQLANFSWLPSPVISAPDRCITSEARTFGYYSVCQEKLIQSLTAEFTDAIALFLHYFQHLFQSIVPPGNPATASSDLESIV